MLYRVQIKTETTICVNQPGYRSCVEEWKNGFVEADNEDFAEDRVTAYYMSENSETCIVKVLEVKVRKADKTDKGFFVDFCLPVTV